MPSPVTIITDDHKRITELFTTYQTLSDVLVEEKEAISQKILKELTVHTKMEENLFYPKLKEILPVEKIKLVEEAIAEHHAAKMLILELKAMNVELAQFDPRLKVLQENVISHIKEEEAILLPLALESLTPIQLERLGEDMMDYKKDEDKSLLEKLLS